MSHAGIGSQTWRTPSAPTEPSGLSPFLGSPLGTVTTPNAPVSTCFSPDINGVILSAGASRPYHLWEGAAYPTGILPPEDAPTMDSTGAQATRTLIGASTPVFNNGDVLTLTDAVSTATINIVTTLTMGVTAEVVAPATSTSADKFVLAYLQQLIKGNGTNGTNYWDPGGNGAIGATIDIEILSLDVDAYTMTFQAKTAGTLGNIYTTGWTSGAAPDPTVGAFSGGTSIDGEIPAGQHYWATSFLRSLEGGRSGLSPTMEGILGEESGMPLEGLVASVDSTVDMALISRTVKGGYRFYGVDTQSDATADYDDIAPDTQLVDYGALYYNERLYRSRQAGYPQGHSHYAFHNGAIWGGGCRVAATYAVGFCSVQGPNHASGASTTVTLATGHVTEDMVGRSFVASGVPHLEHYTIISVDPTASPEEIELASPYQGLTAPAATYEIIDDRDPNVLEFAVVGQINQWPAQQSMEGVSSDDGLGITGLSSKWERLNVFTDDSIWWVRGNSPTTYQMRKAVSGVGTVNGATIVADGQTLYWLDRQGIYAWSGSGEPVRVSNPRAPDGSVRGIQGTINRINWPHRNWCHAVLDPDARKARWFVPLDDDVTPRHAITLDLSSHTFSVEYCPDVTASAVMTKPNGDEVVVLGTLSGDIFEADTGETDGAYGFVPLQTLTGSQTAKTLTVSGTGLPTTGDGLDGIPVLLKDASGAWELREVASNTSSVITLDRETSLTMAAGDQIMVGGIPMWVQTGDFDLGVSDTQKILSNLYLTHVPSDVGEYFVGVASGSNAQAAPLLDGGNVGDLTDEGTSQKFRAGVRGPTHQFSIFTADVGCRPSFRRFAMDIRARDQIRVGG